MPCQHWSYRDQKGGCKGKGGGWLLATTGPTARKEDGDPPITTVRWSSAGENWKSCTILRATPWKWDDTTAEQRSKLFDVSIRCWSKFCSVNKSMHAEIYEKMDSLDFYNITGIIITRKDRKIFSTIRRRRGKLYSFSSFTHLVQYFSRPIYSLKKNRNYWNLWNIHL